MPAGALHDGRDVVAEQVAAFHQRSGGVADLRQILIARLVAFLD
jgi:hypothetical protein